MPAARARTADSRIGQGPATLGTAIGEAAWLTGLERNSDVVAMASYAPLLQNVNAYQWSPDLISFDALTSYGSPPYYVQRLFSTNHGSVVVPTSLSSKAPLTYVASKDAKQGRLYLTVVNSGSSAQASRVVVRGATAMASHATVTVLTSGSVDDENSLTEPRNVYPVTRLLEISGTSFAYTFKPNSVTVFALAAKATGR